MKMDCFTVLLQKNKLIYNHTPWDHIDNNFIVTYTLP